MPPPARGSAADAARHPRPSTGGGGAHHVDDTPAWQPRRHTNNADLEQLVAVRKPGTRSNQRTEPLPRPTGKYPYRMDLAEVLGPAAASEVTSSGKLVF